MSNEKEKVDKVKEKTLKALGKTREKRDALAQETKDIELEIRDIETEFADMKRERTYRLKSIKEKVSRREDLLSALADAQQEQDKKKQEVKDLGFWVEAFSPSGIQSFLLEYVTPLINRKIFKYLQILSDGVLGARFETQKTLKSGEKREKFSLEAWSRTGAQSYSLLSGGEKARINVAVSLALADVKRTISGANSIDLLILDEALEGLDQEGRERILEFLKTEFPNRPVFVVSHDYLRDSMFTFRHRVEKKNGLTTIGFGARL